MQAWYWVGFFVGGGRGHSFDLSIRSLAWSRIRSWKGRDVLALRLRSDATHASAGPGKDGEEDGDGMTGLDGNRGRIQSRGRGRGWAATRQEAGAAPCCRASIRCEWVAVPMLQCGAGPGMYVAARMAKECQGFARIPPHSSPFSLDFPPPQQHQKRVVDAAVGVWLGAEWATWEAFFAVHFLARKIIVCGKRHLGIHTLCPAPKPRWGCTWRSHAEEATDDEDGLLSVTDVNICLYVEHQKG